jgi:hypothetical protein
METSTTCPRCGSQDVVQIVYGMPGPELVEESAAGRVALGGCMVGPDSPDSLCQNCRHGGLEDEGG